MPGAGKPLLYTLHCGNFYGTERMALATLEGLTEYRRVVLAPRSTASPSVLDVARDLSYEVRPIEGLGQLLLALIPVFLRHRQVDVISSSASHNLVCAWLARVLFVRLRQLNVVHGGGEERHSYANKHRLNGTRVRLVAVSRFVQERLLAHDVRPDKIEVIANFLSPSDARTRPRRPPFARVRAGSRPKDTARIRVAVVSRLDPVKRLDLILEAVATGQLADFRFDVFGAGDLLSSYRERAAALGGTIEFHGYVADVGDRLAAADFLLHVCPDEPFGLVVLEAFNAGLPVIVPDAGGPAELVEDGVSGLTYAAGDLADLLRCLKAAAALADARLDAMAAAARAALDSRYSAAVGVEAYRRALAHAGR
ncbi:MAG TPA: glycosyltransferase family 4 protein [Caldimonas sp.]|jgi:glycosyltransferase involved in cell wall biosynthesis|nr:glycosyltransferase family 4 protein [Caldimonas sp.]HEX2542003.1 glycosyltransferase family 4 protein [Caldimonas sp.]